MKYFAILEGDMPQVERFIRFEADSESQAETIANEQAEKNYALHGEPFEDGLPKFSYFLCEYNPQHHDRRFKGTYPEWTVLIS